VLVSLRPIRPGGTTLTAPSQNNFIRVTDQLWSIGQPTVGTVVVAGVTQFKQIYTRTTATGELP